MIRLAGLLLGGLLFATAGEPVVTLTVVQDTAYYEVNGRSRQKIYDELESNAPDINGTKAAATIDYSFNWRTLYGGYTFGSYTIDSAWVELDITYTFPRWTGYPSHPEDALRKQWEEFYAALEKHEDGHKEIVMYHAGRLKLLLQTYAEEDRDTFTKHLREKANAIIDACKRENDRYDQETAYGKNQGGVWLIK